MSRYDSSQFGDRAAWTRAKRIGDAGELRVALLLKSIGGQVSRAGNRPEPFDLHCTMNVEVKTDRLAKKTGNVAVEVAHHNKPSGLATSTADVWAFVIGADVLLVTTAELRRLVSQTPRRVPAGERGETICALVPVDDVRRIAQRITKAA